MIPSKTYENRELSWLKFNSRVLGEALDKSVPLAERLSFFSIFQTNLDEFFMVRVGSLIDRVSSNANFTDNKTLMTPSEQLSHVFSEIADMEKLRDEGFGRIRKELSKENIEQINPYSASKPDKDFLEKHFKKEIKQGLFPVVLSKSTPFPFLKDRTIFVVCELTKSGSNDMYLGIVPIDSTLKRFIEIPDSEKGKTSAKEKNKIKYALAEDIVLRYADNIFKNYNIKERALMRITRNADLSFDFDLYGEETAYPEKMKKFIRKRKKLAPVRIQMSDRLSETAMNYLIKKLSLGAFPEKQISITESPLDFSFVSNVRGYLKSKQYRYEKHTPKVSYRIKSGITFGKIAAKDILLCYPYDTIKPFVKFMYDVAFDKQVTEIKITLYRLAKDSKIADALCYAAAGGKKVTVLMELRARFDEENNVDYADKLESAGCNVIYGPNAYKVHSKLLLITREVNGEKKYFTQVGTGNYNEKTSELYTDFSLLTANQDIGKDAQAVFKGLCNGDIIEPKKDGYFRSLLVSPTTLQSGVAKRIDIEIEKAKNGEPAYIGAKLNSISDKFIIDKLITASKAGVKMDFLVRGICCFRSGVKGETENITVSSIVGRYLEHSRIYIFGAKDPEVYISSADLMTRNTTRRVEVAAPIYDKTVKHSILRMFGIMLADNVKRRVQHPDGSYVLVSKKSNKNKINSQEYFSQQSKKNYE
ncbi:MAG: polyphosphate kinase 1 [Ruminococcus sp.]|jgi:polyphosphate kinase|nr:polyphosphate kinase 1 [Ruminococcus sp.]